MDANGRIYLAELMKDLKPDEEIEQDKARLDGYLRGRAEADLKDDYEAIKARVHEMQKQMEDEEKA